MYKPLIKKEEINKLEVIQFEGEIRLVDNEDDYHKSISEIRRLPILGFDTETKPVFKKGRNHKIALIQISSGDMAWLFRVNKLGFRKELKALLEDENTLKIGAGLLDDMHRLQQLAKFNPGGFLDLQKYVEAFGIESKSLKKLVAIVLGYKISKSQQMSNWEADELTEQQLRYAATDAWVSLEIYNKLRSTLNDL